MKWKIPFVIIQLSERGLITFSVIVACTTLLLAGKDTQVGYTLVAVVIGYYGIDLPIHIVRSRKREDE